jgi:hypothetical protein
MQNIESSILIAGRSGSHGRELGTLALFMSFCLFSALLISWKPLQLSIITVFLFAGPHNWMEFRYFLSRMPAGASLSSSIRWDSAALRS